MNGLPAVFWFAGNLVLLSGLLFLIAHYHFEKSRLRAIVQEWTGGARRDMSTLLTLAGIIHSRVRRGIDPPFVPLPFLSELGATPLSVLLRGGCCSGLSRLYILSLQSIGIRAGQVTLYHVSGKAQHCLVQVWLDDRPVLVDPMYGFYYVDACGNLLGLGALLNGTTPHFVRLPMSTRDSYPANTYYHFAYTCTKTANWTNGRLRRACYRVLCRLTRGKIDRVEQPAFLEWPQLVLASSAATVMLMFNLLLAVW